MRLPFLFALFALAFASPLFAADDYVPGLDSKEQTGVPKGEVTHFIFDNSKIFPGTTRNFSIYVPKQYESNQPACLMVFQDGMPYKASTVFDNLIAKKEMPVTIGVFITPGVVKAASSNSLNRFNRSYEYDGLGDNYPRFLIEEILPEVTKKYNISTNANDHAVAGSSSGGIAAFTAAWERPDFFRRVFTSVGTYVGLRGGDVYPTLIRKTEPKPIRIFLQDGSGDQNIYGGNWFLANQEMLSALEFAGYEVNHAWGDGGHNGKHATAVFPDALRWLWKDYPAPVTAGKGSKQPVMTEVIVPGEDWQVVSAGHRAVDGPTANAAGEIFFSDIAREHILKVGLDGKVSTFVENKPDSAGLMFGPDGKLFACQFMSKRIVSYDTSGKETTVAEGADCNDLAVTHAGEIYFTDHRNKKIWFINAKGEKRVVDDGITYPNGIRLTPDQSLLLVSDTQGQFVYSFAILPDGSLAYKQRYFDLHLVDGSMKSGADGMTVDTDGRLYVATEMGIQVCDQAGRVIGIISKPQHANLVAVAFGGADRNELYVACGDTLYKRKTKVTGVFGTDAPIKPAAPRL